MFKTYTLTALLLITALSLVMTVPGNADGAKKTYKALDPADMDTSIKAGDDFYHFSNGNWLKNNPVPDAYSRWGSFEILAERNQDDLLDILKSASKDKNAPEGSNTRKIGDFYAAAMDEIKIEEDGIKPLALEFNKIADIKNKKEFQDVVAHLHTIAVDPLFGFFGYIDPGNSKMVIPWFFQGGLGLPDRDFYTDQTTRSQTIRDGYLKHMTNIFVLLKETPAQAAKSAATVLAFETKLAEASMTRLERRDPKATYNPTSIQDLDKMTPEFDFAGFLKTKGVSYSGNVNVGMPKFIAAAAKLVGETPLPELKTYLRWHLIHDSAPYLTQAFVKENFEFYGKTLNGSKIIHERWKRVLNNANSALGEALGEVYVKKHFPPEAKTRALELVKMLRVVLSDRINDLTWMSDETKKKAQEKLAAFGVKIGYPDKWKDYSELEIKRDSYALNMMRAGMFNNKVNLAKIGKAPDPAEWGMAPQTVNAYYSPQRNEIVFPAAILQPPFFNFTADDAVNYGGIGAVIGHEMTHGFDDQGSQYDNVGNLKNWWSDADNNKFKELAGLLATQFDGYRVDEETTVNGKFTLGENIADLGGLNIALDGLLRTLKGKKVEKIDGYTPLQRFFLSWGKVWRNNIRMENLLMRIKTDPHSPGEFRAIGPIVNMPEFYEAFNVKEGEKLYKPEKDRIKIW